MTVTLPPFQWTLAVRVELSRGVLTTTASIKQRTMRFR